MASALDLGDAPLETPKSIFDAIPEGGIGLSDYARQVAGAAYALPGQAAGAVDYLTRGKVEGWSDIRDWSRRRVEEQYEEMSPAAQRNLAATTLPGDGPTIWDKDVSTGHAIGLRVAGAVPSLIASMLPGALVARAALAAGAGATVAAEAGTLAGGLSAGVQTGGDTFNNIMQNIAQEPDEKLQESSEAYRGLRLMGMSEKDAKDHIGRQAAGYKPLIMAAVTALTSRYGVESLVAHRAAGEVGKGFLRRTATTGVGELSQEGVEGATQEMLQQQGTFDAKGGDAHYDWQKVLEAAASGALVGGITGGAVGAATGRRTPRNIKKTNDPTPEPSTLPDGTLAVTPGVTSEGLHTVAEQERAVPGSEIEALDTELKATGGASGVLVQTPPRDVVPTTATGLAPDEMAALEYGHDEELGESPESGLAAAIPPVPQVPTVASPLAEKIGAEPAPPAPGPIPQAAPVEAAIPAVPAAPAPAPGLAPTAIEAAPAPLPAEAAIVPAEPVEAVSAPPVSTGRVLEGAKLREAVPVNIAKRTKQIQNQLLKKGLPATTALTRAREQAQAEYDQQQAGELKPETWRNEPRLSKLKKKQLAAGVPETEVLGAKELAKRQLVEARTALTDRTKAALAETTFPAADTNNPRAITRYAKEIVGKAQRGDISLANLPADADASLRLLKVADQIAKGAAKAETKTDFMTNVGLYLRGDAQGAIREHAQALAPGGASLVEEMAPPSAVGTGKRENIPEEEVTEEIDAKRAAARRAELEKAEAEAQAKARAEATAKTAAAMQGLVAGEAKRPVTVERKKVVTPPGKRENLFERRRREAEEKEREAAAEVERTRKRREIDREKGIAEMMALMQERDEILAGKTDFADAMLPAQDMARKIEAVQRRLETQLESKNAASQAYRSAVQQHEQRKQQAAEALPRRGADPAVTKRAEGDATARTTSESINQIKRAAIETATAPDVPDAPLASRRTEGTKLSPFEQLKQMLDEGRRGALQPEVKPIGKALSNVDELIKHAQGDYKLALRIIANRIKEISPDTTVTVLDDKAFEDDYARRLQARGVPAADAQRDAADALAVYWPSSDEIYLRTSRIVDPEIYTHDLLHEGTHAVYSFAIRRSPEIRAETKRIMEAVKKQFNREMKAEGKLQWQPHYGLFDEHEFVSVGWTNEDFQALLKRTVIEKNPAYPLQGKTTAWRALISQLARIFAPLRRTESAAMGLLRITEALDNVVSVHGVRPAITPVIRFASRATGGPMVYAADIASDGTSTIGRFLRGVGIKGATGQMLSDVFDKYFGHKEGKPNNPIARLNAEHDAMRVLADKEIAKGLQPVEEYITEIQKKDPDEAAAIATLAHNATKANVNVIDKANATWADLLAANPHLGDETSDRLGAMSPRDSLMLLQEDFMKLKPESRRWLLTSTQMLRDIQNRNTKAIVDKLIAAIANPNLTEQQRDDLRQRTMTGKLTEADSELVGDKSLLKALARAQEFRLIDGLYVPLMRRGDHVVETMDRMGDLHGGKMVADDILEFTAPSGKDKDGRAMLKAWSKANSARGTQKMEVMGVGKQRRLMDGTVVSEVDARGHDHTVSYRVRVQRKGLFMFESNRMAAKFIKEHKANNTFEHISDEPEPKKAPFNDNSMTSANMQTILAALNARTDVDDGTKAYLGGLLQEASVRQLSGNRFQQRALPRRRVRGHDEDLARNLRDYVLAASYSYARTRHMDPIRAIMKEMNDYAKASKYQPDNGLRLQVIKELEARVDTPGAIGEDLMPQWARNAMALVFLARLAYPAQSVINSMQVLMNTLPVVGGRYGYLRSGAAFLRAYNDVGGATLVGSGLYNTAKATGRLVSSDIEVDTSKLIEHVRTQLAKAPDAKFVTAVFNEAVDRGKVDDGSMNELIGIASGRSAVERGIAFADRAARQLPLSIETLNRAASLVMTARLARASGMSDEAAIQDAFKTMMNTQGDYGKFNNPRVFQNKWLSPALMFKRYAVMVGNLLVDMVRRAKWGSPEEKRVAYKQLMGMLAGQMAFAGMVGLPGLELLKAAFMVTAAMGFSDGWEEQQRKLRRVFERAIGKGATEKLMYGVISRSLNIDLSAKMSMADMVTFGEPKTHDAEGIAAYFGRIIGGAPGGLALDMMQGVRLAGDGKFWEGFQKFVPLRLATDMSKALSQTDKLYAAQTPAERVMQGLGFRSGRMAEEGQKVGAAIAVGKRLEENAKKLRQRYEDAKTAGERLKVKNDIAAHNKAAEIADRKRFKVSTTPTAKSQEKRRERRQEIEALRK